MTHNDTFNLKDVADNLANHSSYYCTLFYLADACTRDFNHVRLRNTESNNSTEKMSKSIYPRNTVPRIQNYELVLKYDIFISNLQFDLLDNQANLLSEDDYNPFDSFKHSMSKESKQDQSDFKCDNDLRLALLSLIVESTKINFSMIENSASEKSTNITKMDIIVSDWILVNELFYISPDLDINFNETRKVIPLHPKLFDTEIDKNDVKFEEYDINIQNILKYSSEHILIYWQRGKKYNETGIRQDWIELSLFNTMTSKSNAIDQYLETGDILFNVYKSLNTKLSFRLFWKYAEQLYLPQIDSQMLLDFHVSGFILQASSLHEWHKYIPPYHEYSQQSDLAFKFNTKYTVKVHFDEIAIDYTPWVTNANWLEVYKNYNYHIHKDTDENSSDEDFKDTIYKTSTRTIVALDVNLKAKIEPDDEILDMSIKVNDLTAYLLWTSQYSPKWSSDLLIDNEHSITSMYGKLLSKMGFVNIASLKEMDLNILSKPRDKEDYMFEKDSKLIAMLPENLNDQFKIPYMRLLNQPSNIKSSRIENAEAALTNRSKVKIDVSNISIYLCHDSIWGLYLLSECANVHINESIKLINKRTKKPKSIKNSRKAKFSNSLSQVQEDSSESDQEEKKKIEYNQGILFKPDKPLVIDNYIESCIMQSELPMKKKISDYMQQTVEESFDIIGESKVKPKDEFKEGEVKMFGVLDISNNYMNMLDQNKSKSISNLITWNL